MHCCLVFDEIMALENQSESSNAYSVTIHVTHNERIKPG